MSSIQSNNYEESKDASLSVEQVLEFYDAQSKDQMEPVSLESMLDISKSLTNKVPEYRHNHFQGAVAGICISRGARLSIVVAPTGSGKTWVQALIAKYFCNQGKRVVLVEPNNQLML